MLLSRGNVLPVQLLEVDAVMGHDASCCNSLALEEGVEQLRREILAAVDGQLLAPDEPFLNHLTLGDYLDLPDAERARLWDRWTADADLSWEEVDVRAGALPAR